MFIKYVSSRRNTTQDNDITIQTTTWTLFRKSKFFISVLLITTYFILTVVPSLIRAIFSLVNPDWRLTNEKLSIFRQLNVYFIFSSTVSQTTDAFIYIFLQKQVRHLFCKTFNFNFCSRTTSTTSSTVIEYTNIAPTRNENIELQNISSSASSDVTNI